MAFLLSQDQMSALVESALGHLARTHKGDMFPSRLYDAAFKFAGSQVFAGETYALYKSGGDSVLVV